MDYKIDILKGIHPGKIIERDLKKKHLTQRALSKIVKVPYQTINAIIAGKRNLTTELALNIEKTLGYDEGFLLILQSYFFISAHKDKISREKYLTPPNIRKSLFWDTEFDKINWSKYQKAVINRVLERGNEEEQSEIARFYNVNPQNINTYRFNNYPIVTKTI
jgi:addiction module HigA family antidote